MKRKKYWKTEVILFLLRNMPDEKRIAILSQAIPKGYHIHKDPIKQKRVTS